MTKPRNWLFEFEALRGLSIVLLFFLHAGVFGLSVFGWFELDPVALFAASFLLGSFFFLAGYFFDMSIQRHSKDLWRFIYSRFIRIYPPYWLALSFFTMMFTLRKRELLVYLLNLQIVFSPAYVKPLLTLWYVSLLVIFYVIFGLLIWRLRSNLSLFIGSFAVFGVIYIIHLLTDLFDERAFMYYFVFLAGIYFFRFEDLRVRLFQIPFRYKILTAAVGVFIFWFVQMLGLQTRNWLFIAAADFFILAWVLLSLSIFRTKIGNWKMWAFLSTASYFAYLLHRPIWYGLEFIFSPADGGAITFFRAVPASGVVLLVAYFLQFGYDRLLAALHLK
ncbi:acyltransferase [Chloroflexota bacterium]